jgi:hypothetical protein
MEMKWQIHPPVTLTAGTHWTEDGGVSDAWVKRKKQTNFNHCFKINHPEMHHNS